MNPVLFYGKGSLSLTFVREGQWYRLITAMFLHEGLDHYFSNMLLLYFMGDMLERKVGSVKYLFIYMASGVIGNLVSCLHEYVTGSYYISFGASGAVFGIIGMLFYVVFCFVNCFFWKIRPRFFEKNSEYFEKSPSKTTKFQKNKEKTLEYSSKAYFSILKNILMKF